MRNNKSKSGGNHQPSENARKPNEEGIVPLGFRTMEEILAIGNSQWYEDKIESAELNRRILSLNPLLAKNQL